MKRQQFLCVSSDSIWLVTLVHHSAWPVPPRSLLLQTTGAQSIHASTHPRIPFHACLVERQRLVTLVIPDWPLQPETPCAAGISLGGLDPPERSRRMPRLVLSLPSSSLDLARAASSSVLSLAAIADALTAHEQTAPEDKPC